MQKNKSTQPTRGPLVITTAEKIQIEGRHVSNQRPCCRAFPQFPGASAATVAAEAAAVRRAPAEMATQQQRAALHPDHTGCTCRDCCMCCWCRCCIKFLPSQVATTVDAVAAAQRQQPQPLPPVQLQLLAKHVAMLFKCYKQLQAVSTHRAAWIVCAQWPHHQL